MGRRRWDEWGTPMHRVLQVLYETEDMPGRGLTAHDPWDREIAVRSGWVVDLGHHQSGHQYHLTEAGRRAIHRAIRHYEKMTGVPCA